jgi:hypothetical protein
MARGRFWKAWRWLRRPASVAAGPSGRSRRLVDGRVRLRFEQLEHRCLLAADPIPGISVDPTSGLATSEDGVLALYTLVLDSQPAADVTVTLQPGAQLQVGPGALFFNSDNWNLPQTVMVYAVDDAIAEGSHTGTIEHAVQSADMDYAGIAVASVTAQIEDNDSAGILVGPTGGLLTTESGGQAMFTVRLTSEPTAPVTIPLVCSLPAEGSVYPATLTFAESNWYLARVVIVTGVGDGLPDGNVAYSVATLAAVSTDPNYDQWDASDVSFVNVDTDQPGITVNPSSGLATTEAGGSATFAVMLNTAPTAPVTVSLTSSEAQEGTVSPASLTFTTANWHTLQSVTVTGADDLRDDGDVGYLIQVGVAASADPGYSGLSPVSAAVTNLDEDLAGVAIVPSDPPLVVLEGGAGTEYTVALTSEPMSDVMITVTPDSQLLAMPTGLTFTAADWNVPQTVTVAAVDDEVAEDSRTATLTHAIESADSVYQGVAIADATVQVSDNDVPGVQVLPTMVTVSETGDTAAYALRLATVPTDWVQLTVTADAQTLVSLDGALFTDSVTFARADRTPQTITVKAEDDNLPEGTHTGTISHAISGAVNDPHYAATLVIQPAAATILDNDPLLVTIRDSSVFECGGATTGTVTRAGTLPELLVSLVSSDAGKATVPGAVTIPAGSASATFTILGVDNLVPDGAQTVSIVASAVGFVSGQGTLEVVDGSAWQNQQEPFDVSGDGNITPLDVLLIINYINAGHGGTVPPVLINHLNDASGSSGGGEQEDSGNAEGEAPEPATFAQLPSPLPGAAAAAPSVGQTFASAETLPSSLPVAEAATTNDPLAAEPASVGIDLATAPDVPDAFYPALETPTLDLVARDTGRQWHEATLHDLALAEFGDPFESGLLV